MELFNFKTAYTQTKELYGLELIPDEFETLGIIAWEKIGNKMEHLKNVILPVEKLDENNGVVVLPCDVDKIESITIDYPDYQTTSNVAETPLVYNQYVEKYIDIRKGENQSSIYKPGKLIKYRIIDSRNIEVSLTGGNVNILYKSIIYDEDGLPILNAKEVDAIAAYCAYSHFFKQSLMTRDQNTFQLAQVLDQKWKDLCSHARTPMYLSQNDFDAIGDVRYSWDRKSYGKTYKPVR